MSRFERITEFEPAFDKRDPDPNKNYGIHGVEIRFVLVGREGAVHFVLYTDWFLPAVQEELGHGDKPVRPHGVDVGYHSPRPMFSGQDARDSCSYLGGKPCYYDGSSLRADDWVKDVLLPHGSEGVWNALVDEYEAVFHVTAHEPSKEDVLKKAEQLDDANVREAVARKVDEVWR